MHIKDTVRLDTTAQNAKKSRMSRDNNLVIQDEAGAAYFWSRDNPLKLNIQMSLLTYPGSKRNLAKDIDAHIPQKVKTVLSPFFGGGSYEFHLARNGIRVIACDTFGDLVNFWNVVRTHKKELCDEIRGLTPVSERKFKLIRTSLMEDTDESADVNDVNRAAKFYCLNKCSFGGMNKSFSKKNTSNFNIRIGGFLTRINSFEWPENLTLIRCDYRDLLKKYPRTFAFMDPPYMLEVVNKGNMSNARMYGLDGTMHSTFDHMDFFKTVKNRKSKWIITYNDHAVLHDIYRDFTIEPIGDSSGFYNIAKKRYGQILIKNE